VPALTLTLHRTKFKLHRGVVYAQSVKHSHGTTATVPSFRPLRKARHFLARLAQTVHFLAQLAQTAHFLARLAQTVHFLAQLAQTVHFIARLAQTVHFLARLAQTVHFLAQLAQTVHFLARLAQTVRFLARLAQTVQTLSAAMCKSAELHKTRSSSVAVRTEIRLACWYSVADTVPTGMKHTNINVFGGGVQRCTVPKTVSK
jgi:glutaredoxin 2